MNVRVTFFFEYLSSAIQYASAALGWTETFYGKDPGGGPTASLDGWLNHPDLANYVNMRRTLLYKDYRIAWVRVTDETNPRSFKVAALENKKGLIEASRKEGETVVENTVGQVNCALLVDLVRLPVAGGEASHHRRFLIRAIPADVIGGNVVNTEGFSWANVKNFLNWLANHETGALPRAQNARPPAPATSWNATLGLKFQAAANLPYTAAPGVTVSPGDKRVITVAENLPGTVRVTEYTFRDFPDKSRAFNRTWRLLFHQVGPPAVSVLGATRRDMSADDYVVPGPGRYRMVVPDYGLFNQYTIIGLRNKKTGRLFRQLRGRSRSR